MCWMSAGAPIVSGFYSEKQNLTTPWSLIISTLDSELATQRLPASRMLCRLRRRARSDDSILFGSLDRFPFAGWPTVESWEVLTRHAPVPVLKFQKIKGSKSLQVGEFDYPKPREYKTKGSWWQCFLRRQRRRRSANRSMSEGGLASETGSCVVC